MQGMGSERLKILTLRKKSRTLTTQEIMVDKKVRQITLYLSTAKKSKRWERLSLVDQRTQAQTMTTKMILHSSRLMKNLTMRKISIRIARYTRVALKSWHNLITIYWSIRNQNSVVLQKDWEEEWRTISLETQNLQWFKCFHCLIWYLYIPS